MQIIGSLITIGATAGTALAVLTVAIVTLVGAVKGLDERRANRPSMRVIMFAIGLAMLAFTGYLGLSVLQMFGHMMS
ncbi:MAG: hypothetical protein U0641_20005 [Anaerolineae bacterium]